MDFREKKLPFKSYGEKNPFSRIFGINEGQKLYWSVKCCLRGGSHRCKTSEIGHCLPSTHSGYEASYAHAQRNTVMCMLLHTVGCTCFRPMANSDNLHPEPECKNCAEGLAL